MQRQICIIWYYDTDNDEDYKDTKPEEPLRSHYYIGLLNLSLLDDWRFSMDTTSTFEDNAARRLSTCRSACQSSLLSFQAVEIISGWYSPAGVWRRHSSQLVSYNLPLFTIRLFFTMSWIFAVELDSHSRLFERSLRLERTNARARGDRVRRTLNNIP